VRAIAGVALFSNAPAGLAAFYGMLLGVRFERRLHDDGREHRIANVGGLQLEVKAALTPDGEPTPDAVVGAALGVPSSIEISVEVDDAVASFDYALRLGATAHMPVETHPWGAFGVVLDPDGNRLGLWSKPAADDDDETGSR
jgi:predicted enzyme related to lactoylglutathione lyase